MTRYRYTGDDEREFPAISLLVRPGDEVEADENPDPTRFTQVETQSTPVEPAAAPTPPEEV